MLTLLLHPHTRRWLPNGLLDGSTVVRSRELWAQALTIVTEMPVSIVSNKLWTFRFVRGLPRLSQRFVDLTRHEHKGSVAIKAQAVHSD